MTVDATRGRRIVLLHQFALPAISGLTVTLDELVRLIPEVDGGTEAFAAGYDRFASPEQLVGTLEREYSDATCVVGLNIHIEVGWEFTLALAAWCHRSRTRLYLYAHDYWPHHRDGVALLTEKYGAQLLTITPAIASDLAAEGFPSTLVPAGIPVPATPLDRAANARSLGRATVAAVGRLVPRKRFTDVIGAFCASGFGEEATLYLRVPPSLVFPPDQDDQRLEELRDASRRCDGSAVTVDRRATVGTDYTRWALYVSASEYEGLSMTPLEAVIQGCPFVLSDVPPHRDIVDALFPGRRAEFIFPVGDRHALADLLRHEVATGTRRRAVGEHIGEIRQIVEHDWSLRSTARALVSATMETRPGAPR